jgi:hypothetical protein
MPRASRPSRISCYTLDVHTPGGCEPRNSQRRQQGGENTRRYRIDGRPKSGFLLSHMATVSQVWSRSIYWTRCLVTLRPLVWGLGIGVAKAYQVHLHTPSAAAVGATSYSTSTSTCHTFACPTNPRRAHPFVHTELRATSSHDAQPPRHATIA